MKQKFDMGHGLYMRRLSALLLVLFFGFIGIGCDSNSSDETSVADLLADGWTLTSLFDAEGDQSAVFAAGFDAVDITFTENGNFTIDVDSKLPGEDQTIDGTWTVNETQNKLTLTTLFSGIPIGLEFTYAFDGDDVLELTASSATSVLLNQLLGTTLQGTVSFTVART